MRKPVYIIFAIVLIQLCLTACAKNEEEAVLPESTAVSQVEEEAVIEEEPEEETEADPLQPDLMAKYGFTRMKKGVEYPYVTKCAKNKKIDTEGTVQCSEYTRTDLGNGYENIYVVLHYAYDDDNAYKYGAKWFADTLNCSTFAPGPPLNELNSTVTGDGTFSLEFEGQNYDECFAGFECVNNDWERHLASTDIIFSYTLPKGFKGFTVWTTYGPDTEKEASDLAYDLTISEKPVYYFVCD